MNNYDQNAREELAFAKRALRKLPDIIPWHLEKTEAPDALVTTRGRTVGLEIRRIFRQEGKRGSPLRKNEDFRRKIVNLAAQIYERKGGPPVYVSVHYNDVRDPGSQSPHQLSQVLTEIVYRNTPGIDGSKEESYEYTNRAWFPETFGTVRVYRPKGFKKSFWSVPAADYQESLTPDHIRTAIAAKETRIPIYRKKITEIWLLLVTDHGELSSFFGYPQKTLEEIYRASFQRIFVLNWFSRVLYELKVEPLEEPSIYRS